MWALPWQLNWPLVFWYLQLAGYAMLSAGLFYAMCAGLIVLLRRWAIRRKHSLTWLTRSIASRREPGLEPPTSGTWIKVLVAFSVGVSLGYMARDAQQYHRIRQTNVHITGDWADDPSLRPHTYRTEGGILEICADSPDPGFDVGDDLSLQYEEKPNGHGGLCHSFEDVHHTSFILRGGK